MSILKEQIETFVTVCEKQYMIYKNLHEHLLSERDALASGDRARISEAIMEKESVLVDLGELNKVRVDVTKFLALAFDCTIEDISFSFLIERIADKSAVRLMKLQSPYQKLAADIAELNYKNALLTEKMYYHADGRLNLMRSLLNKGNGLYGKNGATAYTRNAVGV